MLPSFFNERTHCLGQGLGKLFKACMEDPGIFGPLLYEIKRRSRLSVSPKASMDTGDGRTIFCRIIEKNDSLIRDVSVSLLGRGDAEAILALLERNFQTYQELMARLVRPKA